MSKRIEFTDAELEFLRQNIIPSYRLTMEETIGQVQHAPVTGLGPQKYANDRLAAQFERQRADAMRLNDKLNEIDVLVGEVDPT